MSLNTTTIAISFQGGETSPIGTSGSASLVGNVNLNWKDQFASGTSGANKASKICVVEGTVDGTGTTYDLNAMTGSVIGAAAVNYTTIASIIVYNTHASNVLYVGGAASNAFDGFVANTSDIVKIPADGKAVLLESPTPVTVGSAKNLKVYGSASGTTFRMVIVGVGT